MIQGDSLLSFTSRGIIRLEVRSRKESTDQVLRDEHSFLPNDQ